MIHYNIFWKIEGDQVYEKYIHGITVMVQFSYMEVHLMRADISERIIQTLGHNWY